MNKRHRQQVVLPIDFLLYSNVKHQITVLGKMTVLVVSRKKAEEVALDKRF
jgi:hypothetical protein